MNQSTATKSTDIGERHTVLFGFWPDLSSHPERSPLKHSYSYASAHDRPVCIDRLTQYSKPW